MPVSKEAMDELVALSAKRDELEIELADVTKRQNALSLALAEQFAEDGIRSVRRQAEDGSNCTLYRDKRMGARLVPGPGSADTENPLRLAHEALISAGLGWMVKDTVNAATLKKWVKEQEAAGGELPAVLQPFVEVWREFAVRVRKT